MELKKPRLVRQTDTILSRDLNKNCIYSTKKEDKSPEIQLYNCNNQ